MDRLLVLGLLALIAFPAEAARRAVPPPDDPVPAEVVLETFTPPAPAAPMALTQGGVDLIVRWEVGGPRTYEARYRRPICPACLTTASGVTLGIGYDLRHASPATIIDDWRAHPQREHLPQASGVGGAAAVELTRRMQHVDTPLPLAMEVFNGSSAWRYRRLAERAFPGMDRLPAPTQDALVSLVYNRGASMTGDARREMRHIRDVCVPARDADCVAHQLEIMVRVWVGGSIEAGMRARRFDEARHARLP